MEESPEKAAQAGNGDAGQEEEEGMEENPGHSSSESEDDSDGDGLAAFMWGRRFTVIYALAICLTFACTDVAL